MFYVVSKSLWSLLQPSSLLVELLVVGLVLSRFPQRAGLGRRLLVAGLAGVFIAGLSPVSNLLMLPLEERFPPRHGKLPEEPVAGIILLGGYEDGRITQARGTLTVYDAADRLTEGALLAHRLPGVPIMISGGAGRIVREVRDATAEIGQWLEGIGIARERILLESKSTTTYENALFAREMAGAKRSGRWILVTSASHMPRAVGAFRAQGFDVIPWPADYRTRDWGDVTRTFGAIPVGLKRLDEASMEWVGLVAYRMLGRSSALFPAP